MTLSESGRPLFALLVVLLAAVLLGLIMVTNDDRAASQRPVSARPDVKRPSTGRSTILTPPAGYIAVLLHLSVTTDPDDETVTAQLISHTALDTYSPKVFGSTGPWEVQLQTDVGERRFGTWDPRIAEAYARSPDDGISYEVADSVEWDLLVPLHDEGTPLGVQTILINAVSGLDQDGFIFQAEVEQAGDGHLISLQQVPVDQTSVPPMVTPRPTLPSPEEQETAAPPTP